ncbi:MAG: hypothetical protein AABX11_07390 [Nanoarchaeota archaeon]
MKDLSILIMSNKHKDTRDPARAKAIEPCRAREQVIAPILRFF